MPSRVLQKDANHAPALLVRQGQVRQVRSMIYDRNYFPIN